MFIGLLLKILVPLTIMGSTQYFVVYDPLEKAQDICNAKGEDRISMDCYEEAVREITTGHTLVRYGHQDNKRYNQ